MVSRLSRAPVFASALITVFAMAGYDWSQNVGWDNSGRFPDAGASILIGPPMPEGMGAEDELSDSDAADADELLVAEPDAVEDETSPDDEEVAPDAPDADVEDDIQEPTQTAVIDDETDAGVRVIEMPRREDPVDRFGEPVLPEDTYELAAVPVQETEETAPAETVVASLGEDGIDHSFLGTTSQETLVAPIPAPLERRPDPLPTGSVTHQANVVQPQVVVPQVVVPQNDQIVWPQRLDQVNTGPQRLDRVNAANRGGNPQPNSVNFGGGQGGNNLFMTDWVEVSQGHYRRVVPQ